MIMENTATNKLFQMRMNLSQKIGVMQSVTSRIACEKKVLKEVIREMFGEQRSDCAKKEEKTDGK